MSVDEPKVSRRLRLVATARSQRRVEELPTKRVDLFSKRTALPRDRLLGDEPYKLEWSNRRIAIHHHASAYTSKGLVYCTAVAVGLAGKKWLLARPAIMGAIETLRKFGKTFMQLREVR